MNCQSCQRESDNYREGKLSGDLRIEVDTHLHLCAECSEIYRIESIADRIINNEKTVSQTINLTARIMDRIENIEDTGNKFSLPYRRVLQPVLIITSLAAAIFTGVLIGNIYKPSITGNSRPVELALIDDATIESVYILSNE